MQELTHSLAAIGCKLWAVSSTNNWVVTEGARRFGIPEENVIAACVHIENDFATDRLVRVPAVARRAFAINPNPDLNTLAKMNGWTIYHPKPRQV